jgi:CP family cyanate transporter-like MFS transporter
VTVGPILPEMTDKLGMSHAVAGLLITLPVLLMAVMAIPGSGLGHRFGSRRIMAVALALLAFGGTLRPLGDTALWVLAWTVPVGVGIGVIGVIQPIFVKEHAAEMPARATGLYVTAMLVGSALGGLTAAPLAELGDSWRVPLLVFGVLGLVPLVGWLLLTSPDHVAANLRPARLPLPWRSRTAWLLVVAFGLQAVIFYGLVTWLSPALVETGMTLVEAGTVVGVMLVSGIFGTLVVSWLGDRFASSRHLSLMLTGVAMGIAVAGFVVVPALSLLWAVVGGLGLAAVFALVMTLPLDAAAHPGEAGGYSALMLGAGYLIAAIAPSALGAVRDATGNFTATMWLLVITAVALVAVSVLLTPARLRPRTS